MSIEQIGSARLDLVDTHCHLWQFELLRRAWCPPDIIYRTFTPTDLLAAAQPVGAKHFVLIEAGTSAEDNNALLDFAASSPAIGAVITHADFASPTLDEDLDRWQQQPKFRGVRMRFEGHPDPDVLTRPSTLAGLKKIAQRGLVFDIIVLTHQLRDLLKICEQVPDLKGGIEHMGKPDLRHERELDEWTAQMKLLAQNTDLKCKLSIGPRADEIEFIFANPGQGWPVDVIKRRSDVLVEHFGPDRLMWGSDWPVVLLEASYAQAYQTMRQALGPLSPDVELKLFRTTAIRFYALAG
ncbi:MAG TPA: amidohydrolase family protein [Caldilineaceae bacterium]|nr:amidohydrolase family protein [Caldilineaceae bacterium]